jgi:catechol 2,3-dioxygenase-like lactoylglutathione lyase family enzyme
LTGTKADRQAHESGVSVDVVAIVVRVSDLDRSLTFYCDVFSCRVAVREADMALLFTPRGFEIYLHQNDEFHSRAAGALGVHHLMWATDSQSDLRRITDRRVLIHRRRNDDSGGNRSRRVPRDRGVPNPPPAAAHGDRRTTSRLKGWDALVNALMTETEGQVTEWNDSCISVSDGVGSGQNCGRRRRYLI